MFLNVAGHVCGILRNKFAHFVEHVFRYFGIYIWISSNMSLDVVEHGFELCVCNYKVSVIVLHILYVDIYGYVAI